MTPRNFRTISTVITGLLCMALLNGCATVVSTPVKKVYFASNPMGAKVYLNGKEKGVTPMSMNVVRWGTQTIRLEMPGYQPHDVVIQKRFNAWVLGNILIGGLVGIAIDSITGSVFEIQDHVYHEFSPKAGRNRKAEDRLSIQDDALEIRVVLTAQIPRGARKIGQLKRIDS